eukprot:m.164194 g.164194  ORF g.164194 m.164194 type:complete len:791 (-) comp17129_c0_seq1:337-2709(-)
MELFRAGCDAASKAVKFDNEDNVAEAKKWYVEAAGLLLKAKDFEPDPAKKEAIAARVHVYLTRAEELDKAYFAKPPTAGSPKSTAEGSKVVKRADAALKRARSAHVDRNFREAKNEYQQAAELYFEALKIGGDDPAAIKQKLTQALDAAEMLKKNLTKEFVDAGDQSAPVMSPAPPTHSPAASAAAAAKRAEAPRFSKDELEVLRTTSHINGRMYLPWAEEDARSNFSGQGHFADPDGPLQLSQKQRLRFARWAPLSSLSKNPHMIRSVSSEKIHQTVVSDCSFVSSLAISADFEKRFGKRLILNSIYPQDANGTPIFNPYGKYFVRLFVNGAWRKVVVDDTLPVDATGNLLCSFSDDRDEFWVSIIEKAYLKVMGGYDFPGSNSGVDLHSMSGWIPERLPFKDSDTKDFDRIFKALHTGDVLCTIATGDLPSVEADRAGLVPSHAYAVLDLRLIDGVRLLKVKNPWSHLRWKGKYSPFDTASWTPKLQATLKYDLKSAQAVDDGVFWIDWDSTKAFFDVLYMNWNSQLFKNRITMHRRWDQEEGPVKDSYNLERNPQFKLAITATESAHVWILLSRHITRIDDFAENKEYITVHVYRGGQRVYYPDDPVSMGTKINSPHYLVKLTVEKGTTDYTLVISQYEKSTTQNFSLRAFSSGTVDLAPIPVEFQKEEKLTGEWTVSTAGGSTNNPVLHERNPKFKFIISGADDGNTVDVRFKLEAPRTYAVGLTCTGDREPVRSTGNYRPGFCYAIMKLRRGVEYTVTPSTFEPGQVGPFFIYCALSEPFRFWQA